MKPTTLFSLLVIFLSPTLLIAQIKNKVNPSGPCCSILSVGPVDGVVSSNGVGPVDGFGPVDGIVSSNGVGPVDAIVLARNPTTGRTFLFKATALEAKNLKVGDPIDADLVSHKITSIKGVTTNHAEFEPNGIDPCCGITKLEAKTLEPCCGIITISNNATGQTYSFNINESYLGETEKNLSVLHQLSTGQPVMMNAANNYVLIKTTMNGQPAYYSYPVNKTMESGGSNSQAWEMQTDPSLKGVTGQLVLQMPKEIPIRSHLQAFAAGESKAATSWFGNNVGKLMPGSYDIVIEKYKLSNVPIEKGKTTRLKVGLLNFTPRQPVTIVDGNQQKFTMAGPFKIVLPVGTYYIDGKKDRAFVMKDGEQTDY
jgi:hypothetical protein